MEQEQGVEEQENEELDQFMDATPPVDPLVNDINEVLEWKGDEELPPSELNPLPEGLRYEFQDDTERFPIIINANLSEKEERKLMAVLKEHRKALGYSLNDIKGIILAIYTH